MSVLSMASLPLRQSTADRLHRRTDSGIPARERQGEALQATRDWSNNSRLAPTLLPQWDFKGTSMRPTMCPAPERSRRWRQLLAALRTFAYEAKPERVSTRKSAAA